MSSSPSFRPRRCFAIRSARSCLRKLLVLQSSLNLLACAFEMFAAPECWFFVPWQLSSYPSLASHTTNHVRPGHSYSNPSKGRSRTTPLKIRLPHPASPTAHHSSRQIVCQCGNKGRRARQTGSQMVKLNQSQAPPSVQIPSCGLEPTAWLWLSSPAMLQSPSLLLELASAAPCPGYAALPRKTAH